MNENLGPVLDILDIFDHFWPFLAFRMSKNADPGFVCIPLGLLSVAYQGGKPSIAVLRNFEWHFEHQKTSDFHVQAKSEKNAFRSGSHP